MHGSPGEVRISVDLGGTQLRAAAVAEGATILSHARRPTPHRSAEHIVAAVCEAVRAVSGAARAGLETRLSALDADRPIAIDPRVVVAVPGPLDAAAGRIGATPNLVALRGFALGPALSAALARPVQLVNDAAAAALGEARRGAGRGFDPVLYLTISTGIGGGVVIGGRPYLGASGGAAELGHLIVDGRPDAPRCGAGHAGCLEALASGTAIARDAAAAGVPPGPGRSAPDAADVFAAARAGNAPAQRIVAHTARRLGLGLASAVNAFDPAIVVLGGGVMAAWDDLQAVVMATVAAHAMSDAWREGGVVVGTLGDDAGLVGAAEM